MTPLDNHRSTNRYARHFLVALAMALSGGCVAPSHSPLLTNAPFRDAWQPTPTGRRIYPSIRFVMEDDAPLLECRIELIDAMGDAVKASGQVKCELFASTGQRDGVVGERLYGWDITMTQLDHQKAFYDPTVRGYLYRLKLASIAPASRPTTLRITFTPVNGAVLMDEAEILPDPSTSP